MIYFFVEADQSKIKQFLIRMVLLKHSVKKAFLINGGAVGICVAFEVWTSAFLWTFQYFFLLLFGPNIICN